jgi:hypothetical protein
MGISWEFVEGFRTLTDTKELHKHGLPHMLVEGLRKTYGYPRMNAQGTHLLDFDKWVSRALCAWLDWAGVEPSLAGQSGCLSQL